MAQGDENKNVEMQMMRRMLASSRYFIAIAVLGTFLSSVVLIVSGVFSVFKIAWDELRNREIGVEASKHLAVDFIQLIDIFLLGTVLYIIALGLYELFVDPDLPMPRWLVIKDFDALKEKLIGVIIVLLGVTYLGNAVTWTGGGDILELGLATAATIIALSVALYLSHRSHIEEHVGNRNEEMGDGS